MGATFQPTEGRFSTRRLAIGVSNRRGVPKLADRRGHMARFSRAAMGVMKGNKIFGVVDQNPTPAICPGRKLIRGKFAG